MEDISWLNQEAKRCTYSTFIENKKTGLRKPRISHDETVPCANYQYLINIARDKFVNGQRSFIEKEGGSSTHYYLSTKRLIVSWDGCTKEITIEF